MRTLFPYMGGKRKMAKRLLELLPEHRCYVEVFAGSAALFFSREEPAKIEVLNDRDREIANVFRVVKHHLEELAVQFRWAISSRAMFQWASETPPETLTDIQRAARWLYIQKLCFGGKPTSPTFGTSKTRPQGINLTRLEEDLSAVHLRLTQVTIECLDWSECLGRYDGPETLFFLDPPYPGLTAYRIPFGWEDLRALRRRIEDLEGRVLMTMRDNGQAREILDGLRFQEHSLNYHVRGGHPTPAQELIATNF